MLHAGSCLRLEACGFRQSVGLAPASGLRHRVSEGSKTESWLSLHQIFRGHSPDVLDYPPRRAFRRDPDVAQLATRRTAAAAAVFRFPEHPPFALSFSSRLFDPWYPDFHQSTTITNPFLLLCYVFFPTSLRWTIPCQFVHCLSRPESHHSSPEKFAWQRSL